MGQILKFGAYTNLSTSPSIYSPKFSSKRMLYTPEAHSGVLPTDSGANANLHRNHIWGPCISQEAPGNALNFTSTLPKSPPHWFKAGIERVLSSRLSAWVWVWVHHTLPLWGSAQVPDLPCVWDADDTVHCPESLWGSAEISMHFTPNGQLHLFTLYNSVNKLISFFFYPYT